MKHSKVLIALCLCLSILAIHGMCVNAYARTTDAASAIESALININTADAEELQTISGIGPKLAARIIEFREENGAFTMPEDIMNVRGLGQAKYAKIKDSLTV